MVDYEKYMYTCIQILNKIIKYKKETHGKCHLMSPLSKDETVLMGSTL